MSNKLTLTSISSLSTQRFDVSGHERRLGFVTERADGAWTWSQYGAGPKQQGCFAQKNDAARALAKFVAQFG